MGTKTWRPWFLALLLFGFITAPLLAFQQEKENPESEAEEDVVERQLIIDLTKGESYQLKVKPRKQYLLYLKGLPAGEKEVSIFMTGNFYDYKEGRYSPTFVLFELKRQGKTPVFTLYTEAETYGYYALRFFRETDEIKPHLKDLIKCLNITKEVDPSTIIPTCFGGVRLYLEGVKPPQIVQFDYGWSMLYSINDKKIKDPQHFFLLNAYPGAFILGYKKAAKNVIFSRISISFGMSLTEDKDERKSWFLGFTFPIVYDFAIVGGGTWQSGDSSKLRGTFGIKIGPELFAKALEAMKILKPLDLSD